MSNVNACTTFDLPITCPPTQHKEDSIMHPNEKPEVRLKPSNYQPSKAELEERVHIDATPEELVRAAFRQVNVVTDKNA